MDIAGYEQRIQELDHRQDEVLERLEELDRRLVSLIEVWAPRRETAPSMTDGTSTVPMTTVSSDEEFVEATDDFEDERRVA